MKIQTTEIYQHLEDNKDKRLLIFQGGSRSGKTYNILIWLVIQLLQTPGITLSIVRKTLPALKSSSLKDLKEILIKLNQYEPDRWHKQDGYYEFPNGSVIDFFSVDESQKIRGRKRDWLYINEANEIGFEDYTQLAMRTTGRIIMDFNPSEIDCYIYDILDDEKQKDEVFFHKSTYRDNPFLSKEIIDEIESLKYKDENLYRVFNLGERGMSIATIFNTYEITNEFPKDGGRVIRALDFGFQDPSAIVEVRKIDDKLYIKELLYSKGLTSEDLHYKIKELGFNNTDDLWCDNARPEMIQDLKRNGINAKPVKKNTILHGINLIKQHRVFLHEDSHNLIEEFKNWRWKSDKDGKLIDAAEDRYNHLIDGVRYCLEMADKNTGKYIIV